MRPPPTPTQTLEADLAAAIKAGDSTRIDHLGAQLEQNPPQPPASILAAALWYATLGLRIFPLQPHTKLPLKGCKWAAEACSDPATIRQWWTVTPDANVAITTGHIVDVIDIDGPLGQVWHYSKPDMNDQLGVVGVVSTPRPGGQHLYVPATGLGNKAGRWPGVDYRGTGGYVVAAPSHNEQGAYRFLHPLDPTKLTSQAAS